MRRSIVLLTVVGLMAVMLAMSAAVALADPPPYTGGSPLGPGEGQGKGGEVLHCSDPFKGPLVFTPSGSPGNSLHDCRFVE